MYIYFVYKNLSIDNTTNLFVSMYVSNKAKSLLHTQSVSAK